MKIIRSILVTTVAILMLSGATSPASAAVQRAEDISNLPTLLVRDYTNLGLRLSVPDDAAG
jgi:hypothetical protein